MKPMVRRIIITEAQTMVIVGEGSWIAHGVGRSNAISRSKSKKRMATRKNRME